MAGRIGVTAGILVAAVAAAAQAQEAKYSFPQDLIPRFNIPHMGKPPVIDGAIGPEEWRDAVRVAGVAWTSSLDYRDRPVSFWVAWDEQHLYLAARSDILPGHRLYRTKREKYCGGVVFDDAYEFGIFMHDRNKLAGQSSSFLKFVVNSLGCAEYMKLYPSIGQNLFNWRPEMKIANRLYEQDGRRWWDQEIAMDLKDLQMPSPHKAGDPLGLLLTADLKNPEWQWLDVPSATGHLGHEGFPQAVLTADRPYVQVEEISGLHDEKISLRSVLYNPSGKAVTVSAVARVLHGKGGPSKRPQQPTPVVEEAKTLTIPARSSVRFDVAKAFPGLAYGDAKGPPTEMSMYEFRVTLADDAKAPPVFCHALTFHGTGKSYLKAVPRTTVFEYEKDYNPVRGLLFLSADTLDAQIPPAAKVAAAEYVISRDGRTVQQGRLPGFAYAKYWGLVELPNLEAAKYKVELRLLDAAGKVLASRDDIGFEKKDEAKVFARWWNNRIGDTEKVLRPFEPLKLRKGSRSSTAISCAQRLYELDSLGLPVQIEANGGPVLARPARIVVKVAGGKEAAAAAAGELKITRAKDWRVEFEGPPAAAAGVRFQAKGSMEQDGLVDLAVTFAPESGPVKIEELRVEWPVDDALGLHMACIGQGGNYCARTIGKVPEGKGEVWNTVKGIGLTGSGLTAGSFTDNLWLGTECRGLLWAADSDRGWDVDDRVPAHSLVREGKAVVIRNHIVGRCAGKPPLELTGPRTIRLGYNATPFRQFEPGWRLNQVSAANGFSGGKYKVNWDTGQDYFSVLSPPFADLGRWPAYYTHCKEEAAKRSARGIYELAPRLQMYLTNQIALRGYMDKTVEPGVYEYFAGDWVPGAEALSKTYTDYMISLQDRQVREGGCTHFYYDITFTGHYLARLAAGFGYVLPDGRIQPEGSNDDLRAWYKRSWAMIQENDLYPGGISGHSTNAICLKALPFADAILDSEYPMKDPIDVYPSDRMIALSCPHNFGVNISHLGFMNPAWAAMHDASTGGAGDGVLWTGAFRHWGIGREDVQFIPYWRNGHVVKDLTKGLIVSLWKRPGSVAMAVMNHGPDPEGREKARAVRLKLGPAALGVPKGLAGERLRVAELVNLPPNPRYLGHLKWVQALPRSAKGELLPLPAAQPKVRGDTLDGFDLEYHHVRYLALSWDERPIDDAAWKDLFAGPVRAAALDWGINTATPLAGDDLAKKIRCEVAGVQVRAWVRPQSVLVRVVSTGDKPIVAPLSLDLDGLGVKVRKLWREFTSIVSLDGEPVQNLEEDAKPNDHRLGSGRMALFNGHTGGVWVRLDAGASRVFCIDRY